MLTITSDQASANIASQLVAQYNQALTILSRVSKTLSTGTEANASAGVPAVTSAQIMTALGTNAAPIQATLTAAGV